VCWPGAVLEVGCGNQPYRFLFRDVTYRSIDHDGARRREKARTLLPRPLAGSVHGRSCGRPRRPRISPEGKVAVCTLAYAAPLCIAWIISTRPAAPASMP